MSTDLEDQRRKLYAELSPELLLRERGAYLAHIRSLRDAGRDADGSEDGLQICMDEIEKRREAGEWSEPQVPTPAAFVCINNVVAGLVGDPQIVSVTMVRRSDWDGGGKDVAFDCVVLSCRNLPKPEHLVHTAVVRCKDGQLFALLGTGQYDLELDAAIREYEWASRRLQQVVWT